MSLSLETITTSKPGRFGAARDGADDVVGLEARIFEDRDAHRFQDAADVRNLLGQVGRRLRRDWLCIRRTPPRDASARRSRKPRRCTPAEYAFDELAQHVVEDVDRLGGEAGGGAHGRRAGARAGVVGAEDKPERIDEEECADFATGCHRGGHKLWDDTGAAGEVPPAAAAELADSLRQVYARVDAAIGRLVEAAGDDVRVLIFSLHGMGENTSRVDLLPEMLARVLAGGPPAATAPAAGRPGLLKRMRELVPNRWRHWVKQRLPLALQDWLTTFWRVGRVDWSATRAFCLVADVQGYVRLNLRGREAEGIVAPGDEYDRLGAEIAAGLSTFVDGASGMPVVHEVVRADRLYQTGARRDLLPDLIVQWARTPRAPERSVRSPRYGAIALPLPGKNADGRSGNHRPHGFLLAAGPGVGAGPLGEAHIMDLAPTVYALFGLAPPEEMQGRVLVLGAERGEARNESP